MRYSDSTETVADTSPPQTKQHWWHSKSAEERKKIVALREKAKKKTVKKVVKKVPKKAIKKYKPRSNVKPTSVPLHAALGRMAAVRSKAPNTALLQANGDIVPEFAISVGDGKLYMLVGERRLGPVRLIP